MTLQSKEIQFLKGVDDTLDEEKLDGTTHRRAVNKKFFYTEGSEAFTCQDDLGNVLRSNLFISGGVCIGSCEIPDQSKMIYVIYENTLGDPKHAFWEYDVPTKAHTLLYQGQLLNFLNSGQDLNINYVNGLVYWCERVFISFLENSNTNEPDFNPPRKFNHEKMKLYQLSDPDGYPSIDYQTLDVIKWPPRFAPDVYFGDDITRSSNLLHGAMYQFCYRYIYDDSESSVFGFISVVPMPSRGENIDGRRVFENQFDNLVNVKINTGHHTVDKIEVAFRKNNNGAWGVFTTIDKSDLGLSDDADHIISFYGDEGYAVIPDEELLPYHLVPICCGAQAVVENNTMVYGDVCEGFDDPVLDVDLTHKVHKLDPLAFGRGEFYCSLSGNNLNILMEESYKLNVGDILYIYALDDTGTCDGNWLDATSVVYSWEVQEGDITGATDILKSQTASEALRDHLIAEYGLTASSVLSSPFYSTVIDCHRWAFEQGSSVLHAAFLRKNRSYKSGVNHPFAIKYYDRGHRSGGAVEHDDAAIYVPFFPEVDFDAFSIDRSYRLLNRIDWKVNHVPPESATHWQWCYRGNSRILDFQHRTVYRVQAETTGRLRLSLDKFYLDTYDGVNINHQIEKGDVVRLITRVLDSTTGSDTNYVDQVYELTVHEYDPIGGLGERESILVEAFPYQDFVKTGTNLDRGFLVEIYTPRTQIENRPYFEHGLVMPIINPHKSTRLHGGYVYTGVVVESIATSGNTFVLIGDYDWCEALASLEIQHSGAGNNGTYNISTSSYDIDTNKTTITTSNAPAADESANDGLRAEVKQDQVIGGIGAGGQFRDGDVYVRQRHMSTGFTSGIDDWGWWVEDFHYSDYFESNAYNKGKISVVDPQMEFKEFMSILRNSQPYLEGSNINGMSEFLPTDTKQLRSEEGAICGLFPRGYTLIVVQGSHTAGVDLNRTAMGNPDGSTIVTATNKVLGSVRYRDKKYGCILPLCCVQAGDNGDVFFWDIRQKAIIRDTIGGQVPIHEHGKAAWWRKQSQEILDDNYLQYRFIAGVDQDSKEVLFTFRYGLEMVAHAFPHATMAYNYEQKRWTSEYEYFPHHYAKVSDRFITFDDYNLYEHNDVSGVPGTYYGVSSDRFVEFVVNAGVKSAWKAIHINTDRKPSRVDFTIRPSDNYPSGMTSELEPQHLVETEGTYWAAILKDMLTPNAFSQAAALLDGRDMRGKTLLVRVTHDSTEASSIRSVVLGFLLSEVS